MLLLTVPFAFSLTPTKPPIVRLNLSVWVSMTSTPEFERSAKYISARAGSTQLMSNDRSGLPGIKTDVRHFVCVFVGAPGPEHGAATASPVANDIATSRIGPTDP